MKSLITIGDGDLRLSSLVDVTVVRGEPRDFQIELPDGYEATSVTGATLDRFSVNGRIVSLTVREPERRRHQFVLTLEQPHAAGSFKADTSFPTIAGVQRESGEVLIEGGGTLQVTPDSDDTVRRMDVREAHAALRGMARQPTLAAFRYQRRPGEPRRLALDVKRFADAPVLSAIAERASATTLVTSEGRMLTEMTFVVRNRAQPFMKVTLPPGASILSAEVAGETARPVTAADGTRVPLLRTGFRPDWTVHRVDRLPARRPAARNKRGDAQMALATVDIPISLLEWELFLPEQYCGEADRRQRDPGSLRTDGMPVPTAPASSANGDAAVGHRSGLGRGNHRLRHRPRGRGPPRRDCHARRRRAAAAGHYRRGGHVPVLGRPRWTGERQGRAGGLQLERNIVHLRGRPTPGGYAARRSGAELRR